MASSLGQLIAEAIDYAASRGTDPDELRVQLAAAAGITQGELGGLLNGAPRCFPIKTLQALADELQRPVAELLQASIADGCEYSEAELGALPAEADQAGGGAPAGASTGGGGGSGPGGGGHHGGGFEEGRDLNIERVQRRVFALEVDNRSDTEPGIPASLSSEAPVDRGDYWEILSHDAGAVDLSRAVDGKLPLLKDHNPTDHIGVAEQVRLAGRKLRAALRFGRSERARTAKADVEAGILTGVSVSYELLDEQPERAGMRDGRPVLRFNRWQPLEASLLAIPADVSVGVNRSLDLRGTKMTTQVRPDADETARRTNIRSLGRLAKVDPEEVDRAIDEGQTLEQFRARVDKLTSRGNGNTAATPGAPVDGSTAPREQRLGHIGLTDRELQKFSLFNTIAAVAKNNWQNAQFEFEACRAAAQLAGKGNDPSRCVIPNDVLFRKLPLNRYGRRDITKAGDGAALVGVDHQAASFIDIVHAASVCIRAGATELPARVGDISIPKRLTSASSYWVTEGNSVTESSPTFDALTGSPHTVGALVDLTRLMMQQSDPNVEALTMSDIAEVLATALDVVCINGGGAGEPDGILQGASIGSVTSGGTFTWPEIMSFFSELGNYWREPLAWLMRPATAAQLMAQTVDTGSGRFVLENGMIADVPVHKTINVPANLGVGNDKTAVILGHFPDLVIARWGSLELMSDPYTQFASGGIRVRGLMDVDVKLRNDESFAAAIDVTP